MNQLDVISCHTKILNSIALIETLSGNKNFVTQQFYTGKDNTKVTILMMGLEIFIVYYLKNIEVHLDMQTEIYENNKNFINDIIIKNNFTINIISYDDITQLRIGCISYSHDSIRDINSIILLM